MAASMLGSLLRTVRQMVPSSASGQLRGYYVDWKMLRDVKRRKMAYEYADERLRINSLRKNTILPKELQGVVEDIIYEDPVKNRPCCENQQELCRDPMDVGTGRGCVACRVAYKKWLMQRSLPFPGTAVPLESETGVS